jgi:3',5'-cyclic AMP phosphodiesterase CpdA
MALMDWFGKRLAGWMNSKIGRGKTFRDAIPITLALGQELRQRALDFTIFSGDAAVLGMTEEYDVVRTTMAPLLELPGIAVPGNHDHYTYQSVRRKLFEHTLEPWLEGERVGGHTYPFARNIGGYWFVAVNSSVPNVVLIDSRGGVGWQQRRRLEELLARLPPGPRILVTHYPLCLANGRSEKRWRRMRDARKVRTIAANGGVCLWLHGHRHSTYFRPAEKRRPFPVACPGSVTQYQRWTYHEYTFNGPELIILRRMWVPEQAKFIDRDEFRVALRVLHKDNPIG